MSRGLSRSFANDKAEPEAGRKMTKIAVVLFNLGGPDKPEAVQPFFGWVPPIPIT